MYASLAPVGHALYRRAFDDGDDGDVKRQLPGWAWMVILADFVVFFPVVLYVS